LIMGVLIGGPVAERLVRRLQAQGAPLGVAAKPAHASDATDAAEPFTPERLVFSILLIAAAMALGVELAALTENPRFTLPTFVWTLFAGALLRNGLAIARLHAVAHQALTFPGPLSPSPFLPTPS